MRLVRPFWRRLSQTTTTIGTIGTVYYGALWFRFEVDKLRRASGVSPQQYFLSNEVNSYNVAHGQGAARWPMRE